MTETVKFKLDSGEEIYLEATAAGGYSPQRAGLGDKAVTAATETFEAALEKVKPAARAVVQAFKEINEPDEIHLEFGLQFKGDVQAFVLSGEATAAFKLSLKWKNDKA